MTDRGSSEAPCPKDTTFVITLYASCEVRNRLLTSTLLLVHHSLRSLQILNKISTTDSLTGFDSLREEDQEKIRTAIETKENPDYDTYHAAGKAALAEGKAADAGEGTGEFLSKKLQMAAVG